MTEQPGRPTSMSEAVARRIRDARNARHMSREELARRCAEQGNGYLTYATLTNIEWGAARGSGRCKRITVDEVTDLARALGIPTMALLSPDACLRCGGNPPEGFTCNTCGGAV